MLQLFHHCRFEIKERISTSHLHSWPSVESQSKNDVLSRSKLNHKTITFIFIEKKKRSMFDKSNRSSKRKGQSKSQQEIKVIGSMVLRDHGCIEPLYKHLIEINRHEACFPCWLELMRPLWKKCSSERQRFSTDGYLWIFSWNNLFEYVPLEFVY